MRCTDHCKEPRLQANSYGGLTEPKPLHHPQGTLTLATHTGLPVLAWLQLQLLLQLLLVTVTVVVLVTVVTVVTVLVCHVFRANSEAFLPILVLCMAWMASPKTLQRVASRCGLSRHPSCC